MGPSEPSRSSMQPPPTGPDGADPNSTRPALLAALSRFEFETGKGNDGTKILMVEWDPSAVPRLPASPTRPSAGGAATAGSGDWEVSWEGKTTVLRARDHDVVGQKRVYFLLPPGAAVPPLITISQSQGLLIETKPLPAIFPPGLGVSQNDVGKRGVLHTIWAKKRLWELQAEIQAEMTANGESVGLEMALQESAWIREHFGIGEYTPTTSQAHSHPQSPASPVSSRAPAGGRLGEKLRGLRLATSPADLVPASGGNPNLHFAGFSPIDGDIAVSSFASFPGRLASATGAGAAPVSLDAALGPSPRPGTNGTEGDKEDDLFALPMSPRSPDMKKSPFSLL